jgi:hypothetical protein
MASDTYPGEPLESNQIRLIRLRPGAWTDPIVCDLYNTRHTNDRDEPIQYYALSYVWGSRGVTREVSLAGRPHKVTVNLERALRYYRHHYPKGVALWVDALCIDQGNLTERTHQVQLMGQIYRRCQKMVVYLGDRLEYSIKSEYDTPIKSPAASESDVGRKKCDARHALQLIRELGSDNHLRELQSFESHDDVEYRFESLRRLMHAPFTPWWDRIWVVQEAAFALKIDVMQGHHVVPWLEFVHAAQNFREHSTSCCSKYLASLPKDRARVVQDFAKRVLNVLESQSGRRLMSSLLRTYRNRQASDPRDKVYALLSLTRTHIVPDYSLSEVDVFCRATIQCISDSGDLAVLSNDLGRKFREDLPSWVPDWGSPGNPIHDVRASIATRCYVTCPHFSSAIPRMVGSTLLVDGKHVATVCEVGEMMWGETHKIVQETLEHWWKRFPDGLRTSFWNLICGDVIAYDLRIDDRRTALYDEMTFAVWAIQSKQSPYYDPDYVFQPINTQPRCTRVFLPEPFWRRELPSKSFGKDSNRLGQDPSSCQVAPNPYWGREYIWVVDVDLQHMMEFVSIIERSIAIATLYRRLLIFGSSSSDLQQKQWAGIGPSDAQVGDKLYVLGGGKTPFILRPVIPSKQCYTIVGDCYVDGMMGDCSALFDSIPMQENIEIA